jgi:hypothetical protein
MNLKGHSIWFWVYCIMWCTYAAPVVTNAMVADQDHPGALIGDILGTIFAGFVGYIILKWIYDKLTKEKPTTPMVVDLK